MTTSNRSSIHVMVRRSWTRLWWVACKADEVLATFDLPTYSRSFTRDGAIAKCQRRWSPKESPWEDVHVPFV